MVLEKPLIDKRELLRALDPIHGRGAGEYGRLRQAQLLSTGVRAEIPQFTGSSGLTLYCSLNRDAISAVRRGHTEKARDIREHAERIEQDTIAPWLEGLSESWPLSEARELDIADDDDDARADWINRVLFNGPATGDAEVAEPVWSAAREVAEVRSRYEEEDANVRLTIGRVWTIDEVFSEVRPEAPAIDESFPFFVDEIFTAGLRLGDPVVIRHEELARGVFLTTLERALERVTRVNRVSGQALPPHLDALLDASRLQPRRRATRPLRRLA
jgi:hypothetical protein